MRNVRPERAAVKATNDRQGEVKGQAPLIKDDNLTRWRHSDRRDYWVLVAYVKHNRVFLPGDCLSFIEWLSKYR